MASENFSLKWCEQSVQLVRPIEREHLRSTGKVFGGKQLVAFGFQSVGHVGSRKSRERVLSVFGVSRIVGEKSEKWNVQVVESVVDRLL